MAEGKMKCLLDISIMHTLYIADMLNGSFDPKIANPYRDVISLDSIKSEDEIKEAKEAGLMALRRALIELNKGVKKKKSKGKTVGDVLREKGIRKLD